VLRVSIATIVFAVAVIGCTQANHVNVADATVAPDTDQKAAATSAGLKGQTACELLTPGEIAGFLKAPQVKKDEVNSGKNEMTKVDFCNWYIKEGSSEGVEITLRRAESADEGAALVIFSAAKGDAVEHDVERDRKAEPISGVGDEAIYSPYPVGNGGNIAFRAGSSAVTITGSASKETLVSMAKLIAQRL
jgi:hypothetical protein